MNLSQPRKQMGRAINSKGPPNVFTISFNLIKKYINIFKKKNIQKKKLKKEKI